MSSRPRQFLGPTRGARSTACGFITIIDRLTRLRTGTCSAICLQNLAGVSYHRSPPAAAPTPPMDAPLFARLERLCDAFAGRFDSLTRLAAQLGVNRSAVAVSYVEPVYAAARRLASGALAGSRVVFTVDAAAAAASPLRKSRRTTHKLWRRRASARRSASAPQRPRGRRATHWRSSWGRRARQRRWRRLRRRRQRGGAVCAPRKRPFAKPG